jgi:adenylate kinase
VCDNCGGEVVQRPDDTAEAIMTRLQAYERQTFPLIDFYTERGLVETIDGSASPDEVFAATIAAIERRRKGA